MFHKKLRKFHTTIHVELTVDCHLEVIKLT